MGINKVYYTSDFARSLPNIPTRVGNNLIQEKLCETPRQHKRTDLEDDSDLYSTLSDFPSVSSYNNRNVCFSQASTSEQQMIFRPSQPRRLNLASRFVNERAVNNLNPIIANECNQSPTQYNSNHLRILNRAPILAKEFRNLRFSGFLDDAPIEKFLYKFEVLAHQHGVPAHEFNYELSALLEGMALDFFWQLHSREPTISYISLKNELIGSFQYRRSDSDIKTVIKNRKQKYREPFLHFYKEIFKLSLALHNPLTQSELLEILTENMRPGLQLEFGGQYPMSVPHFVQRCNEIEELWNKLNYCPDNFGRRNINAIDYKDQDTNIFQDSEIAAIKPGLPNMTFDSKNRLSCWNCTGPHRYQEFSQPIQKVFCFGCGEPKYLKPNCPRCSSRNLGNQYTEVRKAGNTCFRNSMTFPKAHTDITAADLKTNPLKPSVTEN